MNIFVDLIPQMNRTLFCYLCRHFSVYVTRGLYEQYLNLYGKDEIGSLKVHLVDEQVQLDESVVRESVISQTQSYQAYLVERVSDVLGPASDKNWSVDTSDQKRVLETVHGIVRYALTFRELVRQVSIDLVIVNSDWITSRRAIVIEAKRLGIPTFNIEHGFYALQPEFEAFKQRPELRFLSDIVSLDNDIELDIIKGYYEKADKLGNKTFVVNGTPNDFAFNRTIERNEARNFLGLDQSKFVLTIGAAWLPMMAASFAFQRQIELVETYRSILRTLANFSERDQVQVVLKLHPKSTYTGSFDDEKNYLQKMGEEEGVPIALVTAQDLPEVLAATDLLVCTGLSSILWDAASASIPGIRYLQPTYVEEHFHQDLLQVTNPVFREDCVHYVFSENQLLNKIEHYFDKDNYESYKKRIAEVRKKFKINNNLVEEKCENICSWIKEYLAQRQESKSITSP